jgi:hypothetical protein
MKAVLKRDKRAAVTLLKKHILGTEQSVMESVLAMKEAEQQMAIAR